MIFSSMTFNSIYLNEINTRYRFISSYAYDVKSMTHQDTTSKRIFWILNGSIPVRNFEIEIKIDRSLWQNHFKMKMENLFHEVLYTYVLTHVSSDVIRFFDFPNNFHSNLSVYDFFRFQVWKSWIRSIKYEFPKITLADMKEHATA